MSIYLFTCNELPVITVTVDPDRAVIDLHRAAELIVIDPAGTNTSVLASGSLQKFQLAVFFHAIFIALL